MSDLSWQTQVVHTVEGNSTRFGEIRGGSFLSFKTQKDPAELVGPTGSSCARLKHPHTQEQVRSTRSRMSCQETLRQHCDLSNLGIDLVGVGTI